MIFKNFKELEIIGVSESDLTSDMFRFMFFDYVYEDVPEEVSSPENFYTSGGLQMKLKVFEKSYNIEKLSSSINSSEIIDRILDQVLYKIYSLSELGSNNIDIIVSNVVVNNEVYKKNCVENNRHPNKKDKLDFISKKLLNRCIIAGNCIASASRRGPANFIITNKKIYEILKRSGQYSINKDTNFNRIKKNGKITGFKLLLDNNLKEDIMYVGRSTSVSDEPGIHMVVENSRNYLIDNILSEKSEFKYIISELGYTPYSNYLKINVSFWY